MDHEPPDRWVFRPARVLFERDAFDYPLGRELWERFTGRPARPEVRLVPSHNRVTGLPGATPAEAYREAKRTLVVGVRRTLDFAPCRPSADYQLPLVTSCPGMCEYCYLQTTLGPRPYVRVYVNVEEILGRAAELVRGSAGQVSFEGAAAGDPVPIEPLSGALARAVEYFSGLDGARFRFVTKFPCVEGLLGLDHRGHTRARVTVNPESVIRALDRATPGLDERLDTICRLAGDGYPVGVMVAPVFLGSSDPTGDGPTAEDGRPAWDWRREYEALFLRLSQEVGEVPDLTVEVVTHRFTPKAARLIRARYPDTRLPLEPAGRRAKRGRFGYLKYVYPDELLEEARVFFTEAVRRHLPHAVLEYVV